MSQQIVLANPIATAVNPKPTKKEVVDALVQLRIQENQKLNEENAKKKNALHKKIEVKAKRFVTRNQSKTKSTVSIWSWNRGEVEVNFRIKSEEMPSDIAALLQQYHEFDKDFPTSEKYVRREIMEGMNLIQNSSERVAALLKSPASRKALEAILEEV